MLHLLKFSCKVRGAGVLGPLFLNFLDPPQIVRAYGLLPISGSYFLYPGDLQDGRECAWSLEMVSKLPDFVAT